MKLAFGFYLTLRWIGLHFLYIVNFVGIFLYRRLTGPLNNSNECSIQGPKLWALEVESKGFRDLPPNDKGKSSFHWLILNETFLCIIVDLWGDRFLGNTLMLINTHSTEALLWEDSENRTYLQVNSCSWIKRMNMLYQGQDAPPYTSVK